MCVCVCVIASAFVYVFAQRFTVGSLRGGAALIHLGAALSELKEQWGMSAISAALMSGMSAISAAHTGVAVLQSAAHTL